VITPGIRTSGQAAGLPTSFSFFFFLVKKKDTFKQEFIGATVGKPSMGSASK